MIGDVAHDASVVLCAAATLAGVAGGLLHRSRRGSGRVAMTVVATAVTGVVLLRVAGSRRFERRVTAFQDR